MWYAKMEQVMLVIDWILAKETCLCNLLVKVVGEGNEVDSDICNILEAFWVFWYG